MTIRDVLTTTQRRAGRVVRNNGEPVMDYSQIQFTSDCIRRYAVNRGMRIDDAFTEIRVGGGMNIIRDMYAENPHQHIGYAARKLERLMRR